jgi:hypothetical protein
MAYRSTSEASATLPIFALISFVFVPILAQTSCSTTISAGYPAPTLGNGYSARIIANGLSNPRSIKFDSAGNLLVVQSGKGITALALKDGGGNCLSVTKMQDVITDSSVRMLTP